jgi:bis(5'-nucleosidyl)-tetraphosphatase
MSPIFERSAGVIPFRLIRDRVPLYLVIHSATVLNPRARWEFPKGGIEVGESPREAAVREFQEETGIVSWAFREGFERTLSYSYSRQGRRRFKTVTFFLAEVFDTSTQARSHEHFEDASGHWYHWGSHEEISLRLYHSKIRKILAEVDAWLRDDSDEQGRNEIAVYSPAVAEA